MATYTKKFKEFIEEYNPNNGDYVVGYRKLDDSEVRIPLISLDNSITANKYIRKDIDDYANGLIRFQKGLISGSNVMSTIYLQGLDGWFGDERGNFEMNSLTLREFLEVPELRKNKITVMGNQFWFTDSALIKTAVARGNNEYDIHFKLEELEYSSFELNDILKGIYHYANGFYTVYLQVYELILDPIENGEIGVRVRSLNGKAPMQSMLLVRMNNSEDTERQGSLFADGLNKYIRVLDGYDEERPTSEGRADWIERVSIPSPDDPEAPPTIKEIYHKGSLKVQIGDLSKIIQHPVFGDLEGYGLYADNVYLTGKLIVKNDPNAPGQELGVYRGVWDAKSNYYKFDQVTYKGSLYTSKQINNKGNVPKGGVDDIWWELTVSKGEDGESSASNFTLELSNDNHTIPADYDGKNPSYGGAYCTAYVYEGTTEVTELYTITAKVELPATPETLHVVQSDNTATITYIADELTAAIVSFTATAEGYPTLIKQWSISKLNAGNPGEAATAYWLVTDSPVIKQYADGSFKPSPFVIRAFKQVGNGNIEPYNGYIKLTYDKEVKVVAGSVYQFIPTADVDQYIIELYQDAATKVLLDKEIVSVVSDGKDGASPYYLNLDNDATAVPADFEGNVLNYELAKTQATLYIGQLETTADWAATPTHPAVKFILSSTGLLKITEIPVDLDSFEVLITASVFDKIVASTKFTVSKVKGGENGEPAIIHQLRPSVNVITRDKNGVTKPTTLLVDVIKYTGANLIEIVTNLFVQYRRSNDGAFLTYLPAGITIVAETTSVTIQLYDKQGGTLLDAEIIPVISDGKDGANGEKPDWHTYIFKQSAQQPATPTFTTPPIIYPSDGWMDIPNAIGTWWMSTAIVDGTTSNIAVWSTPIKSTGEDGITSFKSTVFKRSNTKPNAPSGGTYISSVPNGWSDGPTDGLSILWASTRVFTTNGQPPQTEFWTEPAQMTDTATFDVEFSSVSTNPGNPTANPANWSNTASDSTIWMATRNQSNGIWDNWQIAKIKGESGTSGVDGTDGIDGKDGAPIIFKGSFDKAPANPQNGWSYYNTTDGRSYVYQDGAWYQMTVDGLDGSDGSNGVDGVSSFKSTVFVRSNTTPTTPTGGSYTQPVPSGWSDGAPTGTAILWMSSRIFSNTGSAPQTAVWTTPAQMTNTASFQAMYSTIAENPGDPTSKPGNWSNIATDASIWLATRTQTNGIWSPWSVSKIKGEDGTDGTDGLSIVWKGDLASPPENPEPNWVYRDTDNGRVYIWNGATWELMVLDGTDGADGINGITYYTWVQYSDNANGVPMYQQPTASTMYIGIATNQLTQVEGNDPSKYTWSKFRGDQGVPGEVGPDGITYYTWIKYATSATGAGISDDPIGKPYIGFAYNKLSQTESNNPADYSWSLIKGEQGVTGPNGMSVYITYNDNSIYNVPAVPTGNGTTGGWHTTPSKTCTWMSQKVAKTVAEGTWGAPIQIRGENGGYMDFKYAANTSATVPPALVNTVREPVGWSDTPPTLTKLQFLWMIVATINPNNTLNGTWSAPVRINGEIGERGPQGLTGADGLQGPSITFAGKWLATTQYYGFADTQTCVIHNGKYYYTKTVSPSMSPVAIPMGDVNNPASEAGKVYWNEFTGQFSNIATGLLMAERIATAELTTNKLFIVDRDESSGDIKAADGTLIGKEEERNSSPSAIIGRLTKGWFMDQGVIRSIATTTESGNTVPKLKMDQDGTITATGVNITGTVYFKNGTIGSMQVFDTADWTSTVNGPYPASTGFYYLRKNNGVTVTPQGHIIGKDYFLTGDSSQGPSVFIGDVYVPGSSIPGTGSSTLSEFLKLFNSLFEKVFIMGQYHIKAKLPLFSVGELTAYGTDNMVVDSIWDALPIDNVTIKWIDKKLTAVGGTEGGISGIVIPSMGDSDAFTNATLNEDGDIITFSAKTFLREQDKFVVAIDKLKKPLLVNATKTGHVEPGMEFPKDTTYEKIIRKILYKPVPAQFTGVISVSNDVEIGTARGTITYTTNQKDSGEMVDAYYTDLTNQKVDLAFSVPNTTGDRTSVVLYNGYMTVKETYKAYANYKEHEENELPKLNLSSTISVNVRRRWFAGKTTVAPTTSAAVRALPTTALIMTNSFRFGIQRGSKTVTFCIPASNTVTKIVFDGIITSLPVDITEFVKTTVSVAGANNQSYVNYNVYTKTNDIENLQDATDYYTINFN